MAERNEQVLDRVRQELGRRSDLGSRQLHEMVQEMDPSMAEMSLPQFHARYVLPIKREHAVQRAQTDKAPAPPRKAARTGKRARAASQEEPARAEEPARQPRQRRTRKAAEPQAEAQAQQVAKAAEQPAQQANRDQVRAVFLEFALDVAQAESRIEIVKVLSKVDEYVDRVVQQGR